VGTDLLDGTVTLPLIFACEADPGIGEVDLRSLDQGRAEAVCERIAATNALERVRELARSQVVEAKATLERTGIPADERRLLALVADGVVERYS
jgi:geranylgeranyl pyrophosphate synthase